jgi:hypothetical protein
MAKATQIHLGEMEDHTKETMKITIEGDHDFNLFLSDSP